MRAVIGAEREARPPRPAHAPRGRNLAASPVDVLVSNWPGEPDGSGCRRGQDKVTGGVNGYRANAIELQLDERRVGTGTDDELLLELRSRASSIHRVDAGIGLAVGDAAVGRYVRQPVRRVAPAEIVAAARQGLQAYDFG